MLLTEDLENKKKSASSKTHKVKMLRSFNCIISMNLALKKIVEATGLTESNIKIKLFRAREMAKHIDKYFDTH